MMKKWILLTLIIPTLAFAEKKWITIGKDAIPAIRELLNISYENIDSADDIELIEVNDKDLELISHLMHHKFKRCGGYIFHDTKSEALETLHSTERRSIAKNFKFKGYEVTDDERIHQILTQVSEKRIRETITKLSSYHNRHYQSKTGVEALNWIKQKWSGLTAHRSDVKVEAIDHKKWKQNSIILTIEGSENPEEIIVIGGHGDSIGSGFWNRKKSKAPGADDNASGIATITEIIKVLMDNSFSPKKTIKFMAYSAEEVGLKGSAEIAKKMRNEKRDVIGVVQFDMTNYKGDDFNIYLINDHTNSEQNEFMAQLIDTYVKVPWGYSKCGYACSDHASWTSNGYPASFPFEATFDGANKKIHSERDTIEHSRGTAEHAVNFAKLGLAFAMEMQI
ncbi:MAG: M20/M25/M40 family metallo-hydrolase [Bdellovibrionales bacterium]|jgi:leucyl aminopeptidase|nr:M20/M25/M40 family metallo-hydrolase [Bdellovibrionales bacterium]